MTITRPVQGSLIEGMERPVGPIPPSVMTGTNGRLIEAVADLYLTGSVLDVSYGEGMWWTNCTPVPFTFHDKFKVDGVDFTALPEGDKSIDTVCFDPPYVLSGGVASKGAEDMRDRFGLDVGFCDTTLKALILDGLSEVCRVASRFVLVKCMEYAQGGKFHDIPTMVTNRAQELGWTLHDRIVHNTGPGPGGHNIYDIKRARRHHSYLLVFAVPS